MEMNWVSQKAHFIIESVMTASLHAQLKAKMAPEPVPDGPAPPAPPNELGRPADPLGGVSVLSHSFCRAASGLEEVDGADDVGTTGAADGADGADESPSNMEESALRLERSVGVRL